MANNTSHLWDLPDYSTIHHFETHYPQEKSYWISPLPSATSDYLCKVLNTSKCHTASHPNKSARTRMPGKNGPSSPPVLGSVTISTVYSTRFQSFKYYPTMSTMDSWQREAVRYGSTPSINILAWWDIYLSQWVPSTRKLTLWETSIFGSDASSHNIRTKTPPPPMSVQNNYPYSYICTCYTPNSLRHTKP